MTVETTFLSRLGRRFHLREVSRAYRTCLLAPLSTEFILPDLAEFCGAHDPAPKNADLFMQGRAAGRRDVWLRLQNFLHLTDDELAALYAGRPVMRSDNG